MGRTSVPVGSGSGGTRGSGSGFGSSSTIEAEVGGGSNDGPRVFKGRPGGTKAAKEDHLKVKQRESGLYAQAAATDKMAKVQMLKAVGLQD